MSDHQQTTSIGQPDGDVSTFIGGVIGIGDRGTEEIPKDSGRRLAMQRGMVVYLIVASKQGKARDYVCAKRVSRQSFGHCKGSGSARLGPRLAVPG